MKLMINFFLWDKIALLAFSTFFYSNIDYYTQNAMKAIISRESLSYDRMIEIYDLNIS